MLSAYERVHNVSAFASCGVSVMSNGDVQKQAVWSRRIKPRYKGYILSFYPPWVS
jgi:hypothetical protein